MYIIKKYIKDIINIYIKKMIKDLNDKIFKYYIYNVVHNHLAQSITSHTFSDIATS